MKNLLNMKNFFLLAFTIVAFISCDSDDLNETNAVQDENQEDMIDISRILGEWESFAREKQDIYLVEITPDLEGIYAMHWVDFTSPRNPEFTIDFYEDYSFGNFYADVLVSDGVWNKIDDDTYTFSFNDPIANWSDYTNTYYVNFYCDNTMSIEYLIPPPAGDNDFQETDFYEIVYFRTPESEECSDLIDFYVE